MRYIPLAAVLAFAAAAHASCEDLARRQYTATWGIDTPVSQVLGDILNGSGWKLDFRVSGREPMVSGNISGPVARVIEQIVARMSSRGVALNYRVYPEQCRILLAVRGAPEAAPGGAASTPAPSVSDAPAATATPCRTRAGTDDRQLVMPLNPANGLLHTQLQSWLAAQGWSLRWNPATSWEVSAPAEIEGCGVEGVVERAIEFARGDGARIQATLYRGNKVVIVDDSGVRQD